MRNALAHGVRGGLTAAGGAATANTIQAIAAGAGLTVLLSRWPDALVWLRVAGGAFLIWLGVMSLRRAWRGGQPSRVPSGAQAAAASSLVPCFRQGLLVNLLNPAITTFYVVVVPSFMPAGAGSRHYAGLAAAHVALAFGCHTAWTLAFDALRRHVERPAVRRALDLATGLVLLGLAAQVLLFT